MSNYTPKHDQVPPTSPSFSLPNVFVTPPEEDQNPPICCFNAATESLHELATLPDIHGLDSALNGLEPAPPFGRPNIESIIMPKRGVKHSMELEANAPGNDSDVVEVIKVRRHKDSGDIDIDATPAAKRPKTFTLRSAFRSIKNVTAKKGKPQAKDIFAASDSAQTMSSAQTRQSTNTRPTLSRRGSVILSSVFRIPTRSSVDILSNSPSDSTVHPNDDNRDMEDEDDLDYGQHMQAHSLRPTSPSPSTLTTQTSASSSRRKFSVMNLRRIFSSSASIASTRTAPSQDERDSESSESDSPRSGSTTPTLASTPSICMPRNPSASSSTFSVGPETPTSDSASFPYPSVDMPIDVDLGLSQFEVPAFSIPESTSTPAPSKQERGGIKALWRSGPGIVLPSRNPQVQEAVDENGDESMEMRLDSLHFESLSFDADRF